LKSPGSTTEASQPIIHDIASLLECIRPNNDEDLGAHSSIPENEADLAQLAKQLEEQQTGAVPMHGYDTALNYDGINGTLSLSISPESLTSRGFASISTMPSDQFPWAGQSESYTAPFAPSSLEPSSDVYIDMGFLETAEDEVTESSFEEWTL